MEPVVSEFMRLIGGGKSLAEGLAQLFENAKDNQVRAGPMFRMIIDMIQNEDKARVHQNFVEEVSEEREERYVLEYVLSDRKRIETIINVAAKRGMLPAGVNPMRIGIDDTIDAEFEHVQ